MPKTTEKTGIIKSMIFASSTGEKKAISCKMFLKGDFNAWNVTVRKVGSEDKNKKEYNEIAKFFEDLKLQAGVEDVNALSGMKINATFEGENLKTFSMIQS